MALVTFTNPASSVWRDYATDGVPASGLHRPHKDEIRTWGGEVQGAFTAIQGLGLGTTGTVGDVGDLDATNKNSGQYAVSAATTGTWPTGITAQDGLLEYKRTAAALLVETLYLLGENRAFYRRYASGAWQNWIAFGAGWGLSVGPPILASVDATDTPGGLARVDGATAGTLPPGSPTQSLLLTLRRATDNHAQLLVGLGPGSKGQLWLRSYESAAYDTWRLLYHQGNILGTVTQTGGVPTGEIIEQGVSTNGRYTRWADGTQLCIASQTASASADVTWTFPAAFASGVTNMIYWGEALTVTDTTNVHVAMAAPTNTTIKFAAYNSSAGTKVAVNVRVAVLGYWF